MDNYFSVLNGINVNGKTEQKGNLTYLSWVWAWGEVKKLFPDATYKIYENANGWNYHTDGKTCWVKTGVTVNGIEHIEYLPVMDNRNNSIKLDNVTSFDVNKAIQRSLTKAIGRHGLGLYIYAGEDLPETDKGEKERQQEQARKVYEDDIASVKSLLDTVVDEETANNAALVLKGLFHTEDSSRDGAILWKHHLAGLGLIYDRVLKCYTKK